MIHLIKKNLLRMLGALALFAPSVFAADTVYTWDASGSNPTAPTDGAGAWNTTSANWTTGSADVVFGNSTTSQANIGTNNGAAGAISVSGTVTLNKLSFFAPGSGSYTLGGTGALSFGGTTPAISIAASQTPTINTILADSGSGITFSATSGSSGSITLDGANTFTGTATISTATVDFNTLALGGTASSFGAGANTVSVVVGNNTSFASAVYTGSGGSTDRPWSIGGSSTSDAIINNGAGAISFNNTNSAVSGTVGARTINLKGSYTAAANTFAETISDLGTSPNITSLLLDGGIWNITGSNTYSGTTTLDAGTMGITASNNFGNCTNITFAGSSTSTILLTQPSGTTVTIPTNVTVNISSGANAIFKENTTTAGSVFEVSAMITGAGGCQEGSSSGASGAAVKFDNNNNFTGAFSMGFGVLEITSVANGGSPSSLGAATGSYTINNSTSFGELQYLGTGNDTTTRPISWTATTGGLTLDSSGSGSVQYLATSALRTATTTGAATLTLQGTSAGANTMGQVINDNPTAGTVTTSLTKSGVGTWILTGENTFSGAVALNGGVLNVAASTETPGVSGALGKSGAISFAGGTLQYSSADTADFSARFSAAASQAYKIDTAGQTVTFATPLGSSSGSLTKIGSGSLTVSGANLYSGVTSVSAGTLALASGASLNNASSVSIAAGATFDVSGLGASATYTLGSSASLLASGTASAATIHGGSSGTVNLGSSPITLTFDGSDPALSIAQGTLSLNGNAITVNSTSPLPLGSYTLIQQASGTISGSVASAVTGTAIPASGTINTVAVSGGTVVLTIVTNTPASLSFNYSPGGSQFNVSWPSDHLGWILQSNSVGVANTNSWFPYAGSGNVTTESITINPTLTNVFFRLMAP